ncbi:MAG: PaaI family thioesterase [Caulobacter sp.]|nr:PaaI family thioesterase [Caulobacter sp.]
MSAADDRLQAMLQRIPYARFLGVRAELAGDEMTMILPFGEHIIGNPVLPAIHGGVLGAFMEMTALAQLSIKDGGERQPRVIDVSVEYLRSGRPLTTYARADIKKVGRRIANVHVEAWQEQRAQPIAALRAHFLITSG